MTDKKTFGSFIKAKRTEKNHSQKDLAEMLFVTEGAVSKWERGVSYPDITLIGDVIESQFKTAYNPNLGAALSLVLMLLIFVCVGVMNRFTEDDEEGMVTV